jgi:DNA-binding transcriptional MerR regulator
MPAKPKKGAATAWISAAQCAARTGLSARALRVYEQQKLLKPARDSNGWRQYSSADLTRLNTIAVLKALGLTLSQIRAQLVSGSSSLEGVLHMQMEAWRARKTAAEDAIALVQGSSLQSPTENRFTGIAHQLRRSSRAL